jgi:hypothetical protein
MTDDPAIRTAIAWLHATQQPDGAWPTFSARHADMSAARLLPGCVYPTTYVLAALRHCPNDPPVDTIRAHAAAFLRRERNADGSWSYTGRATQRVPPDLDDTACAAAALLTLGERPDLALFQLLWENEAAPGGPYYTWIGVNQTPHHLLAHHRDALVNANILWLAGLLGLPLPGTAAYLNDCVLNGDLAQASDYCIEPHLLVYTLARAAHANPNALTPAARIALRAYALHLPAPPVETQPWRIACIAASLALLAERTAAAPYCTALRHCQLADGSWPLAAAYSGYPPWLDGAPALTTALAIEALWLTLDR